MLLSVATVLIHLHILSASAPWRWLHAPNPRHVSVTSHVVGNVEPAIGRKAVALFDVLGEIQCMIFKLMKDNLYLPFIASQLYTKAMKDCQKVSPAMMAG